MNPAIVLRERVEGPATRGSASSAHRNPGRPAVLIATIDADIRENLAHLLENAAVNAIWVRSVKDVKTQVAAGQIAGCLCGFWLQDGTYREVIRHLRRERMDIPAIIVPAPSCPQEYRDYLAAMNLGALDFLSYPYQTSDFERMLTSVHAAHSRSASQPDRENELDFRVRGAA